MLALICGVHMSGFFMRSNDLVRLAAARVRARLADGGGKLGRRAA